MLIEGLLSGSTPNLLIESDPVKGRMVVAGEDIMKGEYVCEYTPYRTYGR